MRLIVQRVDMACCKIDLKDYSKINKGLLIFVCFEINDQHSSIISACDKIVNLRIFPDEVGKMNLNINQVNGEILLISQFTLSWKGEKGNRPSFEKSMPSEKATILYQEMGNILSKLITTKMGSFGADMKIELINNGPVTFSFDF